MLNYPHKYNHARHRGLYGVCGGQLIKRKMEKFYFTFMMSDAKYHNCYHKEEAKTYGEARDKMIERFGTGWAFQ